jgi:hypothetical protein
MTAEEQIREHKIKAECTLEQVARHVEPVEPKVPPAGEAKPLPRTTSSIGNGKAPQSPTALARKAEASAKADQYCDAKGGPPVPYRDTIARAAGMDDVDYEPERLSMARASSVRPSALDRDRALARSVPSAPAAMPDDVKAELEKQYAEAAKHIIASDNVLELLMQETRKVIAGEERNVKVLYLAATSRLFDRPVNVCVKGPSGAGKSEIREKLLAFFPPESVITFTSMSERALIYDTRGFEHTILSMAEAASVEERSVQDLLLRELMSAGKLEYTRGDITIKKTGPVSFMVTTTKNRLHPENETRMLSLEIDDTEAQTGAVIAKIMAIEGLNAADTAINVEPWQDFQRWLAIGNTKVFVPFAEELGQLMPKSVVRLRRDAGQVLSAIKAHALLHRQHREVDDRGQIVADVERDYAAAYGLLNDILSASTGTKVSIAVLDTIEAVRAHDGGATAQQVGELLDLDKSAARRRLLKAVELGLVVNMEAKRGQPGKYCVADRECELKDVLPEPAELQKNRATVPPEAKSR